MKFHLPLPSAWLWLALTALPLSAAPASNFYICASLNLGYVTGSKITTTSGLFRQGADGAWHHLGFNDLSTTSVAFDPRDPKVIYTSAINGCWRSLDGGATWRQTNSWDMTEGQEVAVDPHAPDNVYLALPDGVGFSNDRAQTWTRRENGLPDRGKYTQTIKVDRAQQGHVLAGCEAGIFLTEDAGLNWRRVLMTSATVDDLEQSPADPRLWMAVTQSDGAWTSADSGATWTKVPGVPSDRALYNLTFDPTQASRMAIGSWAHGVLTTEDGGKTWTDRNAGLPEPHRVWRVGVDPASGRLYASVLHESLYSSDDFGRTWKRGPLAGSQVNYFAIAPRSQP